MKSPAADTTRCRERPAEASAETGELLGWFKPPSCLTSTLEGTVRALDLIRLNIKRIDFLASDEFVRKSASAEQQERGNTGFTVRIKGPVARRVITRRTNGVYTTVIQ